MINAVGAPQSLLLLGGTSDIALAIARRYGHAGLRIVLAARPSERRSAAATELKGLGCDVTEVDLDARDHGSHAATIALAFAGGDIDIAVIAFGLLGEAERAWQDPDLALELAEVNYTAPVHFGVLLAQRMRAQAHGWIVALSSVAGERVRRSNFVYGSTKAGFDGFFLGLGRSPTRIRRTRPGRSPRLRQVQDDLRSRRRAPCCDARTGCRSRRRRNQCQTRARLGAWNDARGDVWTPACASAAVPQATPLIWGRSRIALGIRRRRRHSHRE